MFALELTAGLILVAVVLYDVFESVMVPRRTNTKWRLAPPVIVSLWPLWRWFGLRLHPAWRREDFLGTFAPFTIMLVLVIWVLSLVAGYGLVFHALADQFEPRPGDFMTAIYAAGTALLTIGFGDFVPLGTAARMMALLAGASGLAVVALVIALSFNLYESFARREVLVLLLDSRAGVPPSGVTLLETYGEQQMPGQLASLFGRYESWTAELLDSHLAYPVLPFFRSSHDGQSWASALGAVLDAATLLITAVEEPTGAALSELRAARMAADMMYHIGCHALVDLTQGRLIAKHAKFGSEPGVERAEFETACRRLSRAGYRASPSDTAWEVFVKHRSVYATRLNTLARYLAAPPTQWIGDRSILARSHQPHLGH
jgi:Ion channel